MKTRPYVFDERICIRLPRTLVETINKECDKTETQLSAYVRSVLVNALSGVSR